MDVVHLLEKYRGRDKVIRLCSYVGMFISGDRNAFVYERIRSISAELSQCRVVLRLFDDLPMLLYNLTYGLGSKEKSSTLRLLNILTNVANQLYYPVEHIAWLADRKVLSTDSKKWWIRGIYIWTLSLFAEILKQIVLISQLLKKLMLVTKQQYLQSTQESEEPLEGATTEVKALKVKLAESQLSLLQAIADFMNAINWCPPGFLWAGKFSRSWSGVFGIISTCIMLYKTLHSKS